jgi:hypothetical protein
MPVKLVARGTVPHKRGMNSKPPAEYKEALDVMQMGLKPHEAVEIDCSKLPGKHPAHSLCIRLKKEIRRLDAPYDCWYRESGQLCYIVGR